MTMNQLSVGLQAGGQAFSQIIFFEHKGAFDGFHERQLRVRRHRPGRCDQGFRHRQRRNDGRKLGRGHGGGKKEATSAGAYRKGMAVFTVAKGGLMYQAAVGGQKFKYKPNK